MSSTLAGANLGELVQFKEHMLAIAGTTDVNGTPINLSGAGQGDSFMAICKLSAGAADNTIKWEESADGSTLWQDVPGTETGAGGEDWLVSVITSASLGFIRPTVTRGTSTTVDAFVGSYGMHTLPVTTNGTATGGA